MGNNPSELGRLFYPVTNVSWFDAIKFCNKLSLTNGLDPVYEIPSIYTEVEDGDDDGFYYDVFSRSIFEIEINRNASGYRLPNMYELESYKGWTNEYHYSMDRLKCGNNDQSLREGHDSVTFRIVRNK